MPLQRQIATPESDDAECSSKGKDQRSIGIDERSIGADEGGIVPSNPADSAVPQQQPSSQDPLTPTLSPVASR